MLLIKNTLSNQHITAAILSFLLIIYRTELYASDKTIFKSDTRFFHKNNEAQIWSKIKSNVKTIQAGIWNHKCKVYVS